MEHIGLSPKGRFEENKLVYVRAPRGIVKFKKSKNEGAYPSYELYPSYALFPTANNNLGV